MTKYIHWTCTLAQSVKLTSLLEPTETNLWFVGVFPGTSVGMQQLARLAYSSTKIYQCLSYLLLANNISLKNYFGPRVIAMNYILLYIWCMFIHSLLLPHNTLFIRPSEGLRSILFFYFLVYRRNEFVYKYMYYSCRL